MHNAVMRVEDSAAPADTVVEVLQPGYTIGGRVLRPALVKVSG
jgi:molecular chaperone GrpE